MPPPPDKRPSREASRRAALFSEPLENPLDAGLTAHLVEFGEELRGEGVALGTSELLDAFSALPEVAWDEPTLFRETLATTLAKSPEDRAIFDLVFERFFFRATELAALTTGIGEAGSGDGEAIIPGDRIHNGGAIPPPLIGEIAS